MRNARAITKLGLTLMVALLLATGCTIEDPGTSSSKPMPEVPLEDGWYTKLEPAYSVSAIWVGAADNAWLGNQGGQILHNDGTGWKIAHDPDLGVVTALWGFGADDIYAATTGSLLHFDGHEWQPFEAPPFGPYVTDLWGTDEGVLFAARGHGDVARWDGSTWQAWATDMPDNVVSLWGTGPDHVLMFDRSGMMKRFDGQTWTDFDDLADDGGIAMWASAPDHIVALTGEGIQEFNGNGWQFVDDLRYYQCWALWGTGPDDIHIVGEAFAHFDGQAWTIQHRTDRFGMREVHGSSDGAVFAGGTLAETWSYEQGVWNKQVPIGRSQWLTDIWGLGRDAIYVTSGDKGVHKWDGISWIEEDLQRRGPNPLTIWGSAENDIHVAGCGDEILHYDGATWTAYELSAHFCLNDMWGSSPTNIYAVGSNTSSQGRILHYDGATWTALEQTWDHDLKAIGGRGPDDIWVAEQYGSFLHYDGSDWTVLASPITGRIDDVWIGEDDGFAVGVAGTILRLVDGAWELQVSGVIEHLLAVWGTGDGAAIATGLNGCILHFDGTTWTRAVNDNRNDLYGVWGIPGDAVYAVGGYGTVLRNGVWY